MARCPAITRSGEPCKGVVRPDDTYCVAHDPARADARKRNASKGGRAKRDADLPDVKAWLLSLASDVQEGKLEAKDGTAVSQILNIWLRSVETERKIKEQEELEERLESLERVLRERSKAG